MEFGNESIYNKVEKIKTPSLVSIEPKHSQMNIE